MKLSQPTRILLALVVGLAAGIAAALERGAPGSSAALAIAEPIGGLWLNALQMTIVPLVVSLLITGIAASAEAARGEQAGDARADPVRRPALDLVDRRRLADAAVPRACSRCPPKSAAALRDALTSAAPVGEAPSFADFLRSIVPTNPVAAAAEDAILPLIVFVIVFAFALTRLPEAPREPLVGFFQAIADTMLVVIGWVLWIGADRRVRARLCGRRAGRRDGVRRAAPLCADRHRRSAAVIWLAAWPLAWSARGSRRCASPARSPPSQALAFTTQSSLACLPRHAARGRQARRAGRRVGRACCRWRSRSSARPARR